MACSLKACRGLFSFCHGHLWWHVELPTRDVTLLQVPWIAALLDLDNIPAIRHFVRLVLGIKRPTRSTRKDDFDVPKRGLFTFFFTRFNVKNGAMLNWE